MNNKLLSALGFNRRAGKLVMGFDPVKDSVLKGEAILVLIASDLSEKTKKRVGYFCEDYTEIIELGLTQHELLAVTRKLTGVLATTDENLSKLVENNLL